MDAAPKPKLAASSAAVEPDWGEIAFPPDYPFADPDNDDNIVVDDENHKNVMYSTVCDDPFCAGSVECASLTCTTETQTGRAFDV